VRRARVIAAWILLIGSVIGWPISAMTVFADEPPGILGLSWLAIIIGAAELLTGSQIHHDQGKDDDEQT
jgi:hypothetical protein